jgi:hypothetical protein
MKARAGLAAAVMVMVLAGALPAVAAEADEGPPPGVIAGTIHSIDCSGEPTISCDGAAPVQALRCEGSLGGDDPRFSGRYTTSGCSAMHTPAEGTIDDGRLMIQSVVHRVENDDGAWETSPAMEAWWEPDPDSDLVIIPEATTPLETVVFRGTGAYAGLTAVVWLRSHVINPSFRAVILEAEPPQDPVDV